jgi:archaemetzincin
VPELRAAMAKLVPLHKKLGEPKPGDWLSHHAERGQTFAQYLRSAPVLARGKRDTIYIQPLGEMDAVRKQIVDLTASYMALYFGCPVKVEAPLSLKVVPKSARRQRFGNEQILTTYVLDDVLKPRLPKDAAAFLAFTATDLWPGRGWNFVFGQASLRERVGVWSIARNGDPTKSKKSFRLCLLRTLKTATHETGHMFSMPHCIAYECNQCGSNSRAESDRRPLALCPECMAKVCWGSRKDPKERYAALADFCKQHGLASEQAFFTRSLGVLQEQKQR